MKVSYTISLKRLTSLFPNNKKASILILVFWSLAFLSFLGLYLSLGIRQKISLVRRLTLRDSLIFVAEAAVNKAILELSRDREPIDFLKENWSNNPVVFKEIRVGLGAFSIAYQSATGETVYGLIDEERKININKAAYPVLKRLLETVADLDEMTSQELAYSIIDWRDKDSFLSLPIGSAEDSYYQNLPKPYDCKDSDFEVIEELGLVKGTKREIFEKIKDFITIYGEGLININTAPKEVLLSLGLKDSLVDKIISFRKGDDKIEGTSDDNFFKNVSEIPAELSRFSPLTSQEMAELNDLVSQGIFTISSYYFQARIHAYVPGSDFAREFICIIDRKGKILSWRQI